MNLDLAPLEGIGNHIYRNTFRKYYQGVDRYYTPFIDVNSAGDMKSRNQRDILPENNEGAHIVPQLLLKTAEQFKGAAERLKELGYEEVNINMGCPYGTVVKKGKGAGLLADRENLRALLSDIVSEGILPVSVKMRIGIDDPSEGTELMSMLNRFPLAEVIIHPRLQREFYEGGIHEDILEAMYGMSTNPVSVNPGICSPAGYRYYEEKYPDAKGIMIGRYLIACPELAERIRRGDASEDIRIRDRKKFAAFHDELLGSYKEELSGDRPVLFKMKEMWDYWKESLTPDGKILKKIKKASDIGTYRILAKEAIN